MTRETYKLLESFMLAHMDSVDSAHGPEHISRVLNDALDIAAHEENVNLDVLIACAASDSSSPESGTSSGATASSPAAPAAETSSSPAVGPETSSPPARIAFSSAAAPTAACAARS